MRKVSIGAFLLFAILFFSANLDIYGMEEVQDRDDYSLEDVQDKGKEKLNSGEDANLKFPATLRTLGTGLRNFGRAMVAPTHTVPPQLVAPFMLVEYFYDEIPRSFRYDMRRIKETLLP